LPVTRGKITVSGIPNYCNYCLIITVCTEFTIWLWAIGWRPMV